MRRTWWIIGLLIGIGVVGAVVCKLKGCCCEGRPEEEEEAGIENGDQEEELSEEGEMVQTEEATSESDNSDPR